LRRAVDAQTYLGTIAERVDANTARPVPMMRESNHRFDAVRYPGGLVRVIQELGYSVEVHHGRAERANAGAFGAFQEITCFPRRFGKVPLRDAEGVGHLAPTPVVDKL